MNNLAGNGRRRSFHLASKQEFGRGNVRTSMQRKSSEKRNLARFASGSEPNYLYFEEFSEKQGERGRSLRRAAAPTDPYRSQSSPRCPPQSSVSIGYSDPAVPAMPWDRRSHPCIQRGSRAN